MLELHQETTTGGDGTGALVNQGARRGNEGLKQRFVRRAHHALRAGTWNHPVAHWHGKTRRVADVAKHTRKARLQHQDTQKTHGLGGGNPGAPQAMARPMLASLLHIALECP